MKIVVVFLTVLVTFYVGADDDGLKCFICNFDECEDVAQECDGVCGAFRNGGGYDTLKFCNSEEEAISLCRYAKYDAEENGSYCYYCNESECNKEPPKGFVFEFVKGRLGSLA